MKIAIINFSGNVGKSTLARHVLMPRIPDAELIAVESINADDGPEQTVRGRQFAALQEYLLTIDSAIVDIGASNVEELLHLMKAFRGSHQDFDCFIVPTVPSLKQQKDTIATLIELSRLGIHPQRLKLVFNMAEPGEPIEESFGLVLDFIAEQPIAEANTACRIHFNDIYARVRDRSANLRELAADQTNYKAMIAKSCGSDEKIALARKVCNRRLAKGAVPDHDACFAALGLSELASQSGELMEHA
ncbi:MAG: StbB family protein [Roseateles asaccharophilus]|uniref:StbB family protein n=1 Tax=Roseateles asaccharophilus TaxID=582607 RepID=UPI00391C8579